MRDLFDANEKANQEAEIKFLASTLQLASCGTPRSPFPGLNLFANEIRKLSYRSGLQPRLMIRITRRLSQASTPAPPRPLQLPHQGTDSLVLALVRGSRPFYKLPGDLNGSQNREPLDLMISKLSSIIKTPGF